MAWTLLCALALVAAFFASFVWPAGDEWLSSEAAFALLTVAIFTYWLGGLLGIAIWIVIVRKFLGEGGVRGWWDRQGRAGQAGILVFAAIALVTLALWGATSVYVGRTGQQGSDGLGPGPLKWVDAEPAWSPDGERIVFTRGAPGLAGVLSDVNLYTVDLRTGRVRQLTRGGGGTVWNPGHKDHRPQWSPTGAEIAFTRFTGKDRRWVYVMSEETRRLRRLAKGDSPSWSPDGSKLAFLHDDGSLVVASPDGARQVQAAADVFDFGWSPDGSRLVFERSNEIWIVRADGRGLRRLTRSGPGRVAHGPRWSPDGELILHDRFEGGDLAALREGQGLGLYVMRPDGGAVSKIAGGEVVERDWSPDGSRIVFGRTSWAGSDGGLFVADRTGNNTRRLPLAEDYESSYGGWDPGGRRIAIGGWNRGTTPDAYPIMIIDIEPLRATRATQRARSSRR